jgi:L-ascorbate metabolism protein UlaG (beta-lactamase superfamily)
MASPADPAAAGRPALRMPLLLAPLLLALALLLGACAPVAISGNRPPAAHHRDDGFVNSDGTRVNKPPGDLLRWWWSRRDLDLDAMVHPDRIAAAWASLPLAWRSPAADPPDGADTWRVLPVGVDAGAGGAPAGAAQAARAGAAATRVAWFGHATLLFEVGGLRVLTDPHFSERASPLPQLLGPKRLHPVPEEARRLGRIDVVLISHNHYDHLDLPTVRELAAQSGGSPLFLVPLGVDAWMREQGIDNVKGFDWWERHAVGEAVFHFVPAHHWSGRGLWDRNRTLWGGWVLHHPALRAYFAGDTGWTNDIAVIGQRLGPFDLAALPVGAYEPRWFMAAQHVNPHEAVRLHQALGGPLSIGIHWGTFQLTDEPYEAPIEDLRAALRGAGIPEARFRMLVPGQSIVFGAGRAPR